ncbi:hypothetical protein JHN59_40060 [Streptomyces sp. MBT49]|nr:MULTISPECIES: hypothetical protein [unclassified Streptomyces]MBK3630882.1 hypothetical protein [Streptomyces sp. MBT49]MBK3638169.1 hypothetical protein [Streptomyces sp. MBT97]
MITAMQLAGLGGLWLALHTRSEGERCLGRWAAAVALLVSLCCWGAW